MRNIIFIIPLLFSFALIAQNNELRCNVVVTAKMTGNENVQIFRTLETQLNEFINNTKWTDRIVYPHEQIECSMNIIVESYESDLFSASIQVSSSRPVFNSTYVSPLYNFNDRDFTFRYVEFQNLNFSKTQFQSNLISVLAFHVYIILGLDAETFESQSGQSYFEQARTIVAFSQQTNSNGWEPPAGGAQTRSALIDNILSPTYKEYRTVMYQYHRNGLDIMNSEPKKGKERIANTLNNFAIMNRRRPNSFILRVFFDAKSDEIKDIFSSGPNVEIVELLETLQNIAPMYAGKWRSITF